MRIARQAAAVWIALTLGGCAAAPAGAPAPAAIAPAHEQTMPDQADGALMAMGACRPDAPPIGAVPLAPPAWCYALGSGRATADSGPNSWVDTFAAGTQMTAFPPGYRVFEAARPSLVYRTRTFAHNDHWMVDIAGHGDPPADYEGDPRDLATGAHYGGALVRPDRTFRFADGRLVVEFDVAAGMLAYHDGWPEMIVTTAPAPTSNETDAIHAIGIFGGAPAAGCRLYSDRTVNCSAYDGTGRTIEQGGRLFEVSATDTSGALVSGGAPTDATRAAAWRLCRPTDPDTSCRDRFRIELTRASVTVDVNGTRYLEATGLPPGHTLPDALLSGDVYVYFASWVYIAQDETIRFHWGRLAIDP